MHECFHFDKHQSEIRRAVHILFDENMPKLYGNKSDWINRISEDEEHIFEVADKNKHEDWTDVHEELVSGLRIVFVKPSPKDPYRFVGVFEDESIEYMKHSYKRIATKIRLTGDPVYKIEMLDDRR